MSGGVGTVRSLDGICDGFDSRTREEFGASDLEVAPSEVLSGICYGAGSPSDFSIRMPGSASWKWSFRSDPIRDS